LRNLLTLFLLVASAASADTVIIEFTALPFTQMSSTYSTNSGVLTYNGYSIATISGIPNQNLVCDDFNDTTIMPSNPLVFDFSTLVPSSPNYLASEKYNSGTPAQVLQRYEEAAVLMVNFALYMASGNINQQTITDYNYAIWNLFDSTAPQSPGSPNPLSPGSSALQANALNTLLTDAPAASADAARLLIFTPNAANPGNQEFLGLSDTPEPPTFSLITGLLCITLATRRYRD
jgi:hypothetical protein